MKRMTIIEEDFWIVISKSLSLACMIMYPFMVWIHGFKEAHKTIEGLWNMRQYYREREELYINKEAKG